MSRKIDGMIAEYVADFAKDLHKSGYSAISVVERLLRDPGFATGGAQHRVLWWPRNRRVARVSKAFHYLTPIERIILIIHYGGIRNDDQTIFKKEDLAKCSSIGLRKFNRIQKLAKNKIQVILDSYNKIGFSF